jgi:hypothetical protein
MPRAKIAGLMCRRRIDVAMPAAHLDQCGIALWVVFCFKGSPSIGIEFHG